MRKSTSMDGVVCAGIAIALAVPLCGGGRRGYLREVGPSPLRLKHIEPQEVLYRMRPLGMFNSLESTGEQETAEPVELQKINAATNQTNAGNEIILTTPLPNITSVEPSVATNQVQNAGAAAAVGTNAENVVTPQMFLRFFSKDGRQETTVVAPVTQPEPGVKPSSSAIYISK